MSLQTKSRVKASPDQGLRLVRLIVVTGGLSLAVVVADCDKLNTVWDLTLVDASSKLDSGADSASPDSGSEDTGGFVTFEAIGTITLGDNEQEWELNILESSVIQLASPGAS